MSDSAAGADPAARSGPVAGIVLAAGSSTRLGRNKLLLHIEEETLVRRAVRRATESLSPVLVVLGHQAELVERELAGLPCRAVVNREFRRGLNASLSLGVASLPGDASAAVVLLADMPFVTAGMIAALVATYRTTAAPLVISDYQGVVAPPLLYDRSLFPELQVPDGEGAGREVVTRHRRGAAVVSWPAGALPDLDLPADLARLGVEPGPDS
jgi:molybdenum cofactor cytidylyltransferase